MARQYGSFLLRCWRLENGARRIKIEHIQSGEWTQVPTLAAAAAWLGDRWDDVALPQPVSLGGLDQEASPPGRRMDGTGGKEGPMADETG